MPSPQLELIVKGLRSRPAPPAGAGFAEMRQGMQQIGALNRPPEGTSVESVSIDGVSCEWVAAPGARDDAAIMYLHGGGYVLGSPATHRNLTGYLSQAAGIRVLAVDYRLAPEHPHPAAVDDAVTAYRWLLASGLTPERVMLAGDSAGGGLALATMLALRESSAPLPAAAALLSPWVDLALLGESMDVKGEVDPMLSRAMLQRMADAYLAGRAPSTDLASPLYADLTGLPPLLVQVGTAEVLLADALRLAERARDAGVTVELEEYPDLIHVFQWFVPLLPEATEALGRVGKFLSSRA